jgi:hypothetical protein
MELDFENLSSVSSFAAKIAARQIVLRLLVVAHNCFGHSALVFLMFDDHKMYATTHAHVPTHTHTHTHTHKHTHKYKHTYTRTYCKHTQNYTQRHTRTRAQTSAATIFASVPHICMCVNIHTLRSTMQIYAHKHTHTYVRTSMHAKN